MVIKAIILAAGMGTRLKPLTETQPKCLTEVNGKEIMKNAIEILANIGVKETIVVIGYLGDKVKESIKTYYGDMLVSYVKNDIYDRTNTSYSLKIALESAKLFDKLLILEGDVFFEADLVYSLMNQSHSNVTLVQKYNSNLDGSFVELDQNNNVIDWVHKKNRTEDYIVETKYKTVNIHYFSKEFVNDYLVPTIVSFTDKDSGKSPMEDIMRDIVTKNKDLVYALDTGIFKWFEIDDQNDLQIAEQIFR